MELRHTVNRIGQSTIVNTRSLTHSKSKVKSNYFIVCPKVDQRAGLH